jgi:hypothetical protein
VRCNNLIPWMALWKQNLHACALSATVTLDTPCEVMRFIRWWWDCWKMFSRIPGSTATFHWMSGISTNFVPSEHFIILQRAKNCSGLSQVNKVNGPFL